jgi:hypothetical protein
MGRPSPGGPLPLTVEATMRAISKHAGGGRVTLACPGANPRSYYAHAYLTRQQAHDAEVRALQLLMESGKGAGIALTLGDMTARVEARLAQAIAWGEGKSVQAALDNLLTKIAPLGSLAKRYKR